MPNIINSQGLQIATQAELYQKLRTALEEIYGEEVNLAPDTPDGQLLSIFVQMTLDNAETLKLVNSMFDPDQAVGVLLDMRVAINGIRRRKGTKTITPVTITTNQGVTLYGLDQVDQEVYTVKDNAGTRWQLMETSTIPSAGSYSLNFMAENEGRVLTVPNTIQSAVTVVLGVTAINNPSTYTTLGVNEETDYQLRERRRKSVSLSSKGFTDSLRANLENIEGVSSAQVYENYTSSPLPDGQIANSIWVVISGNPDDYDVAMAIYEKRSMGCNTVGDKSYSVPQLDGSMFTVRWDEVEIEPLFVKMNISPIDPSINPDIVKIKSEIVEQLRVGVNSKITINQVASVVSNADRNSVATNIGLGLSPLSANNNIATPSSKKKQLVINESDIIITPMQIRPYEPKVSIGESRQFISYGGYGPMTFTLEVNNSGATIDTSTGLYVAGSVAGTDTLKVEDSLGNVSSTLITVVA